jgi:hypothetical protein
VTRGSEGERKEEKGRGDALADTEVSKSRSDETSQQSTTLR